MRWMEELWWTGRAPGAAPLVPVLGAAALAFRAAVAVRGALYRLDLLPRAMSPVCAISVGNLVVGGAGKTPVTLALARRLQARGLAVAVLSRGYGAERGGIRFVSAGDGPRIAEREAGDEPYLLARRLPGVAVLCGPSRRELAVQAQTQLGVDVVVLDDGFQHRRLGRDLDVVVVDAANPVGNGHLLPLGPNREPWEALRRAGVVWVSRADQVGADALEALCARIRRTTGRDPVLSRHAVTDVRDGTLERSRGPDALRGKRALLVCGIARPDRFRATVAALGADVAAERAFPDHHRFTDAELAGVLADARAAGCDAVATTEKDAVRLPPGKADDPLWHVVRIDAEILAGAEALDAALDRALAEGRALRWEGPGVSGGSTSP